MVYFGISLFDFDCGVYLGSRRGEGEDKGEKGRTKGRRGGQRGEGEDKGEKGRTKGRMGGQRGS